MVVCLVRDPSKSPELAQAGAQLVRGDVTHPATLREPMRGADVVYHLAGMYKFGPKYIPQMRAINVDGARNVLTLAAELGVPKIIHTSSVGVFGNTLGKIVDESYRCPKEDLPSEYERTKWEAHYEVAVPLQARGAPLIIAQPGVVTGPADPSPHIQQVEFYLNRVPLGFGANSGASWAHVDDIAHGHVLVAERGKIGESYIIAGPSLTWKQCQEIWQEITGIPAAKIWVPGWVVGLNQKVLELAEGLGIHTFLNAESLSSTMDYTFWAAPHKAEREIGWNPRPIQETFREMLDYERKRLGK
jgi:nucleoside-diphosphate-sugar epimerase